MTRGNARELAVHLIYSREFTGAEPRDVVAQRLKENYYEALAAENEIYTERPTGKQAKYLDTVVSGVAEKMEELNEIISKFSIGWDIKRISRLSRAIMQLALYEINYLDDVPEGVAASEAVRLAKKYDEEAGKFVNGILGAYLRAKKEPVQEAAVSAEEI